MDEHIIENINDFGRELLEVKDISEFNALNLEYNERARNEVSGYSALRWQDKPIRCNDILYIIKYTR